MRQVAKVNRAWCGSHHIRLATGPHCPLRWHGWKPQALTLRCSVGCLRCPAFDWRSCCRSSQARDCRSRRRPIVDANPQELHFEPLDAQNSSGLPISPSHDYTVVHDMQCVLSSSPEQKTGAAGRVSSCTGATCPGMSQSGMSRPTRSAQPTSVEPHLRRRRPVSCCPLRRRSAVTARRQTAHPGPFLRCVSSTSRACVH